MAGGLVSRVLKMLDFTKDLIEDYKELRKWLNKYLHPSARMLNYIADRDFSAV